MQFKQRFVPDQRFDLPKYNSMLNFVDKEFQAYNKRFIVDENKIVKNWAIENAGGLTVRVNTTNESLLFNTERVGFENINLRLTTDDPLELALANNATNYVEVQFSTQTCGSDTVATWDPAANGGVGEEFTQTVDTINEERPVLVSNTIAFTGDPDKIPLAEVTTSGGSITGIVDSRDFLWHLDLDYNFGAPRTDKNIVTLKNVYDAITTAIKEHKGTPDWFTEFLGAGASSLGLLERFNYILVDGGTISWQNPTPDELSWSGALRIISPSRAYDYTVAAQSVGSVADGEVVYVTLPDLGVTPGGALTVVKDTKENYLIDAANTRGYILAYRSGDKVYFGNGWQSAELEDGEQIQLGDGVNNAVITALGIVDETDSTPPYTSTFIITPGASFTQTISELDSVVNTILGLVSGGVYDEFVSSGAGLTASAQVTLPSAQTYQFGFNQLEVYFDGVKKHITEDYIEINDGGGIGTKIELVYDLPANVKIGFRIQIGGTGALAGATDIYLNGLLIEAGVSKIDFVGAFTGFSTGPGEVEIGAGTASLSLAKNYKNTTGITIPAGSALAFLDDGTIALADANIVTLSDFAGISLAAIPNNAFGQVLKLGNAAGVVSGLSAVPGAPVYLGETPGTLTLTAPVGLSDTILRVGRAEPPDGVATSAADDLFIAPEVIVEP